MMKNIFILFLLAFTLISCNNKPEHKEEIILNMEDGRSTTSYLSVGKEIFAKNALNVDQMDAKYQNLSSGDTIQVKFKTVVNSVCKEKGCWTILALDNDKEVMVKFKDYAFFVPKDIENSEVVVSGKAYITEISVEEQRHYAEDGGQTPNEIARITKPKRTLSFLANGVIIAQ